MPLTKRHKSWPTTANDPDNPSLEQDSSHAEERRSEIDVDEIKEELEETAKTQIHHHGRHHRRPFYVTRRFLFPLGLLLGVILAAILLQPGDLPDIAGQIAVFMDELEISFPQLPDIMDLSRVEAEWKRVRSNIPELWKLQNDGREFKVGEAMKARGLTAEHPVVLIPGIISTGLESWSTDPEMRQFFRQKLWGGFQMVSQVMFNREKWMNALMLDPVTGLDPPGSKVRAAQGIEAATNFVQGYWIWAKIVENLAVVNYDTNNLDLAPYDWRLSFYNLEQRDGYFSRLKSTVEGFKSRQGKKVVLASHSMGGSVILVYYKLTPFKAHSERSVLYLKWVEAPGYGNGGPSWVEDHIESWINIAGTMLGVPKAMTAFLSGEMMDTVQLNPAGAYVLERFFSRRERQRLFLSWAGSASMWTKGGDAIWGNLSFAPDDPSESSHSHGSFVTFSPSVNVTAPDALQNMTMKDTATWALQQAPTSFQRMLHSNYSYGIERDESRLDANNLDHTKWSNPLEVRLPNAPSMKIHCVYGHGKDTERSYWYAQGEVEMDDSMTPQFAEDATCDNTTGCSHPESAFKRPFARQHRIAAEMINDMAMPRIHYGVNIGEGDGTVSLLSLGAMCAEGWRRERWNPAGVKVVTTELAHQPLANLPRGGANTSDHVDILGSQPLNELILKVATGISNEIEDTYVSDIREYASRIQWD